MNFNLTPSPTADTNVEEVEIDRLVYAFYRPTAAEVAADRDAESPPPLRGRVRERGKGERSSHGLTFAGRRRVSAWILASARMTRGAENDEQESMEE